MMMMMKMKKKKLVLTRKEGCDNQLENQITAIITTTNNVSGGLCDRIFIR
jgi:hypothetical protein